MLAAVMIVFAVMLPGGKIVQSHEPRRSIEECWAEARRFALQDPAQHGGVALGAGCMVSGRPS